MQHNNPVTPREKMFTPDEDSLIHSILGVYHMPKKDMYKIFLKSRHDVTIAFKSIDTGKISVLINFDVPISTIFKGTHADTWSKLWGILWDLPNTNYLSQFEDVINDKEAIDLLRCKAVIMENRAYFKLVLTESGLNFEEQKQLPNANKIKGK